MRNMRQEEAAPAQLPAELDGRLDVELSGLPSKYHLPIVLCDLEEKSRSDVAEMLGVPEGTISSRLARGREMLRQRLVRRGLALGAGAMAAALAPTAASAAVPAALVQSTLKTATLYAAGHAAGATAIPSGVALFTKGALKAMFITKLKIVAAALLTVGVVGTGTGVITHQALAAKADAKPAPAADAKPGKKQADWDGKIVAVSADGTQVSIERPAPRAQKGQEAEKPEKVTVTVSPDTKVIYHGVGPDGAKPTVGYSAAVWYVDPNTRAAVATISITGDRPAGKLGIKGDIVGAVTAVAADGKSITFAPPAKAKGQDGQPAQKVEIKLTDQTRIVYSGVGLDGAKPTEGYQATVALVEGSKDVAAEVHFGQSGDKAAKGEGRKGADLVGPVVGVAGDRKGITVQRPASGGKGDQPAVEAQKVELKLTDKTKLLFNNVTTGGAAPAEGQSASVWLDPAAKDTAAEVVLTAAGLPREQQITGTISAVAEQGKRLQVQVRLKSKEEPPQQVEIVITDKTRVSYDNVGPGAAKPTEGYGVEARLLPDSKDTAAELRLSGPRNAE